MSTHPVDIVDYAIELKDRGSRAYLSGNPTLGLQEYKRGLAFMNYLTKNPPSSQKLCNQIRVTLHLNCALMLLELDCFEEAIACSSEALKVADLTDEQIASAYYRRGTAHAGLSDGLGAFEDLLKALKFSPHDRQILKMLDIVEKSLSKNTNPSIRKKYKIIEDGALAEFPEGGQDKTSPECLAAKKLAEFLRPTNEDCGKHTPSIWSMCESVLSPCEIQTIDKSKRLPRETSVLSTEDHNIETTLGSESGAPTKKGDLGLPDDFWDDWTGEVDEDGEPLDKYGNPFFEPYHPYGIVRAVLQDPSFP